MLTFTLLACKEPEAPPLPTFEPVAVGFGLDAVVTDDGTLFGFAVDGETYVPTVVLHFVSALYADATDYEVREVESCVAVTTFEPPPLVKPDQIPTVGDVPLFVSWDTTLALEATSCAGRADPEVWGDDAEDLLAPFEGARFGLGIGPMTDALRATWSEDALAEIGPSLLALWVAVTDVDGQWIATDRSTAIAFDWNEATGELFTTTDLDGNVELVPIDVDKQTADDPMPQAYVQSYPAVYQDLVLVDGFPE